MSIDNDNAVTTTPATVNLSDILNCTGQFIKITYRSEPKPAAAHKDKALAKYVTGVFRAGINFANLQSVKEGIAAGERGPVQGLPWGEWVSFPYLIAHKGKGETYVRLYPAADCGHTPTVVWTVNGVKVTREVFEGFLTPSDAEKLGEVPPCFTVKARNILAIG